ncbi:hypothetical protein EKTHUN627_01690 [Enterobacter kobei]|nr:hypothetical protein EKTHUN627_01690 [Enterobacter kobei]
MRLRLASTEHTTGTQDPIVHWLAHEIAADLQNGRGGVVADFIATRVVLVITPLNEWKGLPLIMRLINSCAIMGYTSSRRNSL